MDDQASVKAQNGTRTNGMLGSLSEFGNDITTLAELQLKLAALDAKTAAEQATLPLGVAVLGAAVALGALPVVLVGLALLLAGLLHIEPGWTMLIVGGTALAAAAVSVVLAGQQLRHSLESFERSRDELVRNVSWIRTVLLYSGRPAAKKN